MAKKVIKKEKEVTLVGEMIIKKGDEKKNKGTQKGRL
jgi:hypothetical protein